MNMSTILERLQHARPGDESLFVLFDGALFPAMQRVYEYESSPQVVPVYYGTRHETSLEVSPCLYEPSAESKIWVCQEDWRDMGVMFTSCYSFLDVLKHLQSLISVRLSSGQLAYWRFYSPGWLASMMDVLGHEDLMDFTGPISQWAAFVENDWKLYRPQVAEHPVPKKDEGWFHLSDEYVDVWKEKKRDVFIQRVAEKAYGKLGGVSSKAKLKNDVSNLFDAAKEAGFKRSSELERFILLFLKHPEAISSSECMAVINNSQYLPMKRLDKVEMALFGIEDKEGE